MDFSMQKNWLLTQIKVIMTHTNELECDVNYVKDLTCRNVPTGINNEKIIRQKIANIKTFCVNMNTTILSNNNFPNVADCIVECNGVGFLSKPKEYSVIRYMTKNFPQCAWIINKQLKIDNESKSLRPDMYVELDDRIVLIEIDEFQHKSYDNSKEAYRIHHFSDLLLYKNLHIVRFNPDEYKINECVYQSCWKINDRNMYALNDENQWNFRLSVLCDVVNKQLMMDTVEQINVVYLFYDKAVVNLRLNHLFLRTNIEDVIVPRRKTKIKIRRLNYKKECDEWKKRLSEDELAKFEKMKELKKTKTKEEGLLIRQQYYDWLYERRPELKKL